MSLNERQQNRGGLPEVNIVTSFLKFATFISLAVFINYVKNMQLDLKIRKYILPFWKIILLYFREKNPPPLCVTDSRYRTTKQTRENY